MRILPLRIVGFKSSANNRMILHIHRFTQTKSANILRWLFCVSFLALAAFLIYLPSELGATLTIPPDSSEYSICLANLFEHGRFGFTLNGTWYPSRYAPWFSLLCLTPAYLLSGGSALCMHWAILVFALSVLIVVWKMGRMCGLGWIAVLPPILLMFMPDFVFYSRVAMTEIPYSALFAILGIVFVRFVNATRLSVKFCFAVGLLIAWAGLVRSTGYAIAIPFGVAVLLRTTEYTECTEAHQPAMRGISCVSCISWLRLASRIKVGFKRKLLLLFAIGLPICLALLVNAGYNWAVFGSPFRSGYHYWCAVPLDFPELAFNWKYVLPNLKYLLNERIIQVTLAFLGVSFVFIVRQIATKRFAQHRVLILLYSYVLIHFLVLACLYLGYYWSDTRFFLPITISSVVLFFASVHAWLSRIRFPWSVIPAAVVFGVCLFALVDAQPLYLGLAKWRPVMLAETQVANTVLPPGSIVIQRGDPSILDYFGFKEKGLTLFPPDRNFDYLMQMTAPRRITNLVKMPESWDKMIIPDLVKVGVCALPFLATFEERPDCLCSFISEGKRVFSLKSQVGGEGVFSRFNDKVERMGLTMNLFCEWKLPGVLPNPVRHFYDSFLFIGCPMDSLPQIAVEYYEIADSAVGQPIR